MINKTNSINYVFSVPIKILNSTNPYINMIIVDKKTIIKNALKLIIILFL